MRRKESKRKIKTNGEKRDPNKNKDICGSLNMFPLITYNLTCILYV